MYILEPVSIALIGASDDEGKLGHAILKNLVGGTYRGKVFPVNPKHTELLGLPCFTSVMTVPGSIDMAIIATPAATVPVIAEECGKKKVRTLVIISAGFGELGTDDGQKRESEITAISQKYGTSIVGPNCLGILRPPIGLNASFAATPSKAGSIALISQSGAMAVALLDRAEDTGLAFSLVVSIGNKADLDEADFIEMCGEDDATKAIGLYLESIKDGPRFVETAQRVARRKPIVLIKAGVSLHGSMAVSSHTGALAGSSAALDAACRAAGIHRASTTEEFLDLLSVLSTQPPLPSRRVAVITNAGGPGVLATDAAERTGLTLVHLDPKTEKALLAALPEAASIANPVDVLGDARADRYGAALHACSADPGVDGIVVILTPQVMTPSAEIAQTVMQSAGVHPLIPIVTSFMGGPHVREAKELLSAAGIPCLQTPEAAIGGMAGLLAPDIHTPETIDDSRFDDRTSAATGLLKGQRGLLPEALTDDLFELYALPTPEQAIAESEDEAVEIARQVGYPVIAKISSPDILHKTDIGGVRVNLASDSDVRSAYRQIIAACKKHRPLAAINGVLIQQFLPIGSEFIVGGIRDDVFGPLVMVGIGGIYTELFRDTRFALAPVTGAQAYDMLSSLQSWRLLTGMRGQGTLDIDGLAHAIAVISQMMTECRMIAEIDLNPVLVGKDTIIVADAKVMIG